MFRFSESAIDSATIELYGAILFLNIPFPLHPQEACGNWGLKCPAPANTRHTLQVALPIQYSYPKIEVGVLMELVTETEKLICSSFPVQIMAA